MALPAAPQPEQPPPAAAEGGCSAKRLVGMDLSVTPCSAAVASGYC